MSTVGTCPVEDTNCSAAPRPCDHTEPPAVGYLRLQGPSQYYGAEPPVACRLASGGPFRASIPLASLKLSHSQSHDVPRAEPTNSCMGQWHVESILEVSTLLFWGQQQWSSESVGKGQGCPGRRFPWLSTNMPDAVPWCASIMIPRAAVIRILQHASPPFRPAVPRSRHAGKELPSNFSLRDLAASMAQT